MIAFCVVKLFIFDQNKRFKLTGIFEMGHGRMQLRTDNASYERQTYRSDRLRHRSDVKKAVDKNAQDWMKKVKLKGQFPE